VKATFTKKAILSKQVTKPILKRKVKYTDEEILFTHSKLAQMEVDENRAKKENEESHLES
jgi:hypothetical protein